MSWRSLSWLEIYFYSAGVVAISFGAFAKNDWLKHLRYRDGTQPSPPMARTILIVTGVGAILIAHLVLSQRH